MAHHSFLQIGYLEVVSSRYLLQSFAILFGHWHQSPWGFFYPHRYCQGEKGFVESLTTALLVVVVGLVGAHDPDVAVPPIFQGEDSGVLGLQALLHTDHLSDQDHLLFRKCDWGVWEDGIYHRHHHPHLECSC